MISFTRNLWIYYHNVLMILLGLQVAIVTPVATVLEVLRAMKNIPSWVGAMTPKEIENNYSDIQMLDAFKAYVKQYSEKSHSVGSIPIIIYHNIDDDRGAYSTSIDLFKSEMRYLYDSGFKTVTMNEVFG